MKKGTIILKNGVTIDFSCDDIYIETLDFSNVITQLKIINGCGENLPLHIMPDEIAAVLCEGSGANRPVIL